MRFISDDKRRPEAAAEMQVLGLGLSRCATSSLQAAFESDVFGMGPCMHMVHVAPHADREQMVLDALNLPEFSPEGLKILHALFDGYGATCDFPGWSWWPSPYPVSTLLRLVGAEPGNRPAWRYWGEGMAVEFWSIPKH